MFIIRQTYVIQNVNGVIYRLSEFECDSVSDLPTQAQTGWNVMTGSKAHVIDTNSWYAIKSTGAWVLQNSDGTAGYTKEEIDALIQDTKDYADGEILGAINDLDVPAVGGTTRYIYQISEANGLIDAKYYTSDATPTTGSTKLVQSKGVKDYVDAETTARQTECGAIANVGAKNLSRATFTSNGNIYGVSFTANADGTVTANSIGTQSQNATLQSSTFLLKAGTYTFSCTENPQRDVTYDSYVYDVDNSRTLARDNPNDSPGSTFTLSVDTNVRINLRVTRTYTANNLVFSPMIRYSVITDATYQPPTLTNTELNDSKITMLNILGAGQRIEATEEAPLNLNDAPFTSVGRFNWLSGSTGNITNCPTYIGGSAKGGILEVSYVQGPSTVLQTARPSAGADSPTIFWQRFRYGTGTTANPYRWTNWFAFTGTEVIPANAQTTNLTSGMRNVAQSTEENDFDPIDEPIEEEMR